MPSRKEPDRFGHGSGILRRRDSPLANAAARSEVVAEAHLPGQRCARAHLELVGDEPQQGVSEAAVDVRPEAARDWRDGAAALELFVDAILAIRNQPR